MKVSEVFVPLKSLLLMGWFLILCVLAPTLAVVVLLGGTGYAIYSATTDKGKKGKSNGGAGNSKRPEYPC